MVPVMFWPDYQAIADSWFSLKVTITKLSGSYNARIGYHHVLTVLFNIIYAFRAGIMKLCFFRDNQGKNKTRVRSQSAIHYPTQKPCVPTYPKAFLQVRRSCLLVALLESGRRGHRFLPLKYVRYYFAIPYCSAHAKTLGWLFWLPVLCLGTQNPSNMIVGNLRLASTLIHVGDGPWWQMDGW